MNKNKMELEPNKKYNIDIIGLWKDERCQFSLINSSSVCPIQVSDIANGKKECVIEVEYVGKSLLIASLNRYIYIFSFIYDGERYLLITTSYVFPYIVKERIFNISTYSKITVNVEGAQKIKALTEEEAIEKAREEHILESKACLRRHASYANLGEEISITVK